jgi:putative transposase
MSIALPWSEFKAYCEEVGPGRGRPARPGQCVFCEGARVWFNGWRLVLITLLVDGRPHRPADWVPLQRVRCARRECGRSWTLRPPWLYPHRSFEPDVAETAALTYLFNPSATDVAVAPAFGCSWITVWRWVGWIAALGTPAALLARAARLSARGGAEPGALPRAVPAQARARSAARARTVLTAAQVLVALALLDRAQPEPPTDPSPLRGFLLAEFLTVRQLAYLTRPGFSPPLNISARSPPGYTDPMGPTATDPDERRRPVALFRHAIIGELDIERLPRGERSTRIAELAARAYRTPDGGERRLSARTLWAWWRAYQRHGLDGLLPKVRADRGTRRAVARELLDAAIALRRELPSRSTATLIHILDTQGRTVPGQLRRATLDRHLGQAGASRRRLKTLGDKRYIRLLFQRPNQLWVGDYHEAPLLWDSTRERYRTLHLSAFIDHDSKLVPHGEWYGSEQIATLEDCLKQAILKRGQPTAIYVDNGAAYRADQFAFACAHLGITLRHRTPYVSEGRGAIERWHRTVVEQFEPEIRALRLSDRREIQLRFEAWLEQGYHLIPHGATGQAPLDRFAQPDFTPRSPDPVVVAETFRVRVRRKVHPKTSTVEVEGVPFLVETAFRGRWVDVHYDPHDRSDVLSYLQGERIQRALPPRPNEPPRPTPDRPTVTPPAFDYLGALRAEDDRRIVTEARRLSFTDWTPQPTFTLPAFLALVAEYLGHTLAPYERDELTVASHTVGPFAEATTRLALEHALRVRGRGLHVAVSTPYVKVFHLSARPALTTEAPRR